MNYNTSGSTGQSSISTAVTIGHLLVTQVSTVSSLINFVTGEQMFVALTAIGDNHFRTAERVLRSLPKVHDKAAQLRIVVSHLEGAHTAYLKQMHSSGEKWLELNDLGQFFTNVLRPFSYAIACKKDVYTCCILAACYAYLKEEELVHQYIEHAEAAQQKYVGTGWDFDETFSPGSLLLLGQVWDVPALFQLRKVPKVSLPDYKNNLLRILPELCNS